MKFTHGVRERKRCNDGSDDDGDGNDNDVKDDGLDKQILIARAMRAGPGPGHPVSE